MVILINKLWGYATSIVRLTNVVGDNLYFTSAYNIKAGVPYLVKPEHTVETPYLTYNNNIVVELESQAVDFDGVQYVGNYSPYQWTGVNEYYYGVSSNAIIRAKETTSALKGMRGYFVLPQEMKARIVIDRLPTDIMVVEEENKGANSGIYSMQGIFLGYDVKKLARGIYIINGKKQIVK